MSPSTGASTCSSLLGFTVCNAGPIHLRCERQGASAPETCERIRCLQNLVASPPNRGPDQIRPPIAPPPCRGPGWSRPPARRAARHWPRFDPPAHRAASQVDSNRTHPPIASPNTSPNWTHQPIEPLSAEHRLTTTGDVTWCRRCGPYSRSRARGLVHACPGRPSDASAKTRLGALRDGKHPVSGVNLVDLPGLSLLADEDDSERVRAAVGIGALRWRALSARVRARERGI